MKSDLVEDVAEARDLHATAVLLLLMVFMVKTGLLLLVFENLSGD